MSIKKLSPIFVVSAIALSATSAFGESTQSSNQVISCQVNNGTPITVAHVGGETTPIFHWRSDVLLPQSKDPQQLCNEVSAKLNNYSGSSLGFGSYEQGGLPTICAEETPGECSLVLVTLAAADKPIEQSERVLAGILDPAIAKDKQVSEARGIQSTFYPLSLWDIIGLKFGK